MCIGVHCGQFGEVGPFRRQGDHVQHSGRQGCVRLGIDTERAHLLGARHDRGSVGGAVRDAADDSRWPLRCAALAAQQRRGRHAESAQRLVCTPTPGRELPAPLIPGVCDQRFLFREKDHIGRVGEGFGRADFGRQQFFDHERRSRLSHDATTQPRLVVLTGNPGCSRMRGTSHPSRRLTPSSAADTVSRSPGRGRRKESVRAAFRVLRSRVGPSAVFAARLTVLAAPVHSSAAQNCRQLPAKC